MFSVPLVPLVPLQINKVTVPLGLIVLVVVFLLPLMPMQAPSFSGTSHSAVNATEYEMASIEVVFISPHVDGDYHEYHGGEGPEGPTPKLPNGSGPLKVYILQEAARKVVELRDQAGNVIAKVTWTLSDLTGVIDDWTGPNPVWSSKVEVLKGFGGNGIGLWLWKFAERIFYQPGMTRLVIDMSVTQSGQTGWTSYQLPGVMDFVSQNVSTYTYLIQDTTLKIWIYQYPYP